MPDHPAFVAPPLPATGHYRDKTVLPTSLSHPAVTLPAPGGPRFSAGRQRALRASASMSHPLATLPAPGGP